MAKETVEAPVLTASTVEIITRNGGTVNVRVGNGTEYEIIKEAETGEVLEYIATAANGWNAVKVVRRSDGFRENTARPLSQ